ncbi:MAG: hypothetical protein QQW96_18390 [Tychonema bourrellyi B0820]|nr:hypothetical protein [Tychonema bourrellyi B0820]
MPTPPSNLLFVEQASCLCLKKHLPVLKKAVNGRAGCPPHNPIYSLLLFVEQASCLCLKKQLMGGQDAHPTIQFTLCGTGILPVLKKALACS